MNKTLVKFLLIYATIIGNIALFFPFVFSALLATIAIVILLEPLSLRLSKKLKISRPISHAIALIVLFLSLTTILVFLIPPLIKETANFYEMVAKFFEGKEWEKVLSPTLATRISQIVSLLEPKLLRFFESMVSAITKTLPQIFTFLFYVILGSVYLTYYFPSLKKNVPYLFPKSCRKEAMFFLRDAYIQLRQYIFSVTIVAILVGILIGLLLWILKTKYVVLLGFWATFTNFIPIIGVFLELIPLFLMTFSLGLKSNIALAIGVTIIHIVAFLIFLKLMEGYIKINPVSIIFIIMLFSSALGILGALIAVPSAIIFKAFWLRFIAPFLNSK